MEITIGRIDKEGLLLVFEVNCSHVAMNGLGDLTLRMVLSGNLQGNAQEGISCQIKGRVFKRNDR